MNLEARLRKLEQESGANGRLIVLTKAEDEDAGQILEANGITRTDSDLVIAVQRLAFVNDRLPPITERIVSIHGRGQHHQSTEQA
jgi:hypothetical protein